MVPMRASDKAAVATDLSRWENEFLTEQRRLLNEPRNYPVEDDGSVEEKPVISSGKSDFAPEADLRTVVIRPRLQLASSKPVSLEDLFAKKIDDAPAAAADEPSLATAAPAELASEDVPPVEEPEAPLAPAPDLVMLKPPSVGIRITFLACACAALAVIFAARSALMTLPATPAVPAAPVAAVGTVAAAGTVAAVAVATPTAPAAAQPVTVPVDTETQALVTQGNHYLELHDVISARLYFERAAEKGDGKAALLAGMTFDPLFLATAGVYGLKGDEAQAQAWYRRARDLGDPEAAKFLPGGAAH